MGVVRRSHAAAGLALAALLLLLLARLPPPAQHRPQPMPAAELVAAAAPALERSSTPANRSTPSTTRRATAGPSSKPTPPPPPQPQPEPQPQQPQQPQVPSKPEAPAKSPPAAPVPAAAAAKPADPANANGSGTGAKEGARPVLTRELYVAGHSRPHPELCPALGARLRVVILISSAPSHRQQRDAVRFTWGHFAARSDVAMGFVLGAPPDSLRAQLDQEDALYGDIIVGRSVDSYSNLTLKTLSMLEWVDTYCPRAPRLLKTDDDMFINVPRLLAFAAHPSRVNATKTIWGKVMRKALPKRSTRSKYYMAWAQFPGRTYPDFATGPAYLVTRDVVRPALAAAPARPYVRLEDVFLTGVLADALGVARRHAPEFYNRKVAAHPCAVQRGVAIHMVRYHEQFDLWRKLLDGKAKCSS